MEDALEDAAPVSPRLARRHGWDPTVVRNEDSVDLFVRLHRRSEEKTYVLRLRYLADWQVAGRRETFVNPDDLGEEGVQFWPRGVRAVNPDHVQNGVHTPAICIPGVWGYDSVLHPNEPREASVTRFLHDLQTVMNE